MCHVTVSDDGPSHHLEESATAYRRIDLQHYVASRTLLWAGHMARMPKSRLPKRLMLSWVQEPRLSGGQMINFGRTLHGVGHHHAGPRKMAPPRDQAPIRHWKAVPMASQGRIRATPEDQRWAIARCAAEVKERRAIFAANANANADTPTNNHDTTSTEGLVPLSHHPLRN
jgi:hypothetical protein